MNTRVPLPAGTVLGKSFEHGIDVNLGTYVAPIWQPIRRISAWAPTHPPVNTDVQTYDDLGNPNEEVTGRGFATSFTVQGNRSLTTGLYLPELEAIVAASKAKGEGAVLDVRWYHKPELGTPNPTDAGRAYVTVEITRSNTDNSGIEVKSVTLTGKGEFTPIPNPFPGWGATAPTITTISPEDAETGDLITIAGSGLLGTISVTIDGDATTEFETLNGASIIAVVPAGEAGDVPVIVTTAGGASAPFTFSRGA